MNSYNKPFTFDRVVRLVIGLGVVILLYLLVSRLSSVLLPFLIGWLIAYMLYPMVKFFQFKMRVKNRILAIFITLLTVAVVLAGLIWLLVPALIEETTRMITLLTEYAQQGNNRLLPDAWHAAIAQFVEQYDFQNLLNGDAFKVIAEKLLPQFWSVLSGTVKFVIGLFVVFMVLLYVVFILIDYEKIVHGFVDLIPNKYRGFIEELVNDVQVGMNKYFRGQALIASTVGVLFAIGFSIIGLPMAITIGIFIGVLNMVPYLQTVGFVPVIFLALLKSMESDVSFSMMLLGVLIVFAVVQGTQDLFLTPKIMGKTMGLNPAVILLSLSVWGSLLGVVGMIIALPITTLLVSYYKRFILHDEAKLESVSPSVESSQKDLQE